MSFYEKPYLKLFLIWAVALKWRSCHWGPHTRNEYLDEKKEIFEFIDVLKHEAILIFKTNIY